MPDIKPDPFGPSGNDPFEWGNTPNLVTSLVDPIGVPSELVEQLDEGDQHLPVIDLDFPCRLVSSQTPGHFHLFLDGVLLSTAQHRLLLQVLAQVGICQQAWVNGSYRTPHGAVAVRLPVAVAAAAFAEPVERTLLF